MSDLHPTRATAVPAPATVHVPAQAPVTAAVLEARIAAQRARLEETLDAIEDKFNVPARAGELAERVKQSYSANPVPWIVGATAIAIGIAGIVAWALSNDE